MVHVFLITAHRDPKMLHRLLAAIEADNHYALVNIDCKSGSLKPFIPVGNNRNVVFLDGKNRMSVQHGAYSQVKCTLRMLKKALIEYPDADYFHLMSGQDYMCVSPIEFDDFFKQNPTRSYMHYDSPEETELYRGNHWAKRVACWNLADIAPSGDKTVLLVRNQIQKVMNRFFKRKEIHNLWGGWNWFSWHRGVVEFVVDQTFSNPGYFRRFHFTRCCDELIFHTLLASHIGRLNIESDNALRFIEWHPKRSAPTNSPLLLEITEFEDIVKSKALICRKVDSVKSALLLNELDKRVFA